MKRLLACIFALCMLSACAASAETAVSDGSLLDIDGFALLMRNGMVYTRNDEAANGVVLTIYPYASQGDNASNINFTPAGTVYEADVEIVNGAREVLKESTISSYENSGFTVESFEYGDAFDVVIGDEPGVALDWKTTVLLPSGPITAYQRQIYMGSKGRTINLTAADAETLDRMMELLSFMVIWY